jgi:hypothetical protein
MRKYRKGEVVHFSKDLIEGQLYNNLILYEGAILSLKSLGWEGRLSEDVDWEEDPSFNIDKSPYVYSVDMLEPEEDGI